MLLCPEGARGLLSPSVAVPCDAVGRKLASHALAGLCCTPAARSRDRSGGSRRQRSSGVGWRRKPTPGASSHFGSATMATAFTSPASVSNGPRRASAARCQAELTRRSFGTLLTLSTMGDLRYDISTVASKLPAMGSSDIFFPVNFEGEWRAEVDVVGVQNAKARLSSTLVEERQRFETLVGTKLEFPVRYFSHRGHIIADRAFNERSLRLAEAAAIGGKAGRVSCEWDPDNPNILTVSERGRDGVREVKVTKRSFQQNAGGEGTFESSEFARIVDDDPLGPTQSSSSSLRVFARRTVIRYRAMDSSSVDALSLDFFYPTAAQEAEFTVKRRWKLVPST